MKPRRFCPIAAACVCVAVMLCAVDAFALEPTRGLAPTLQAASPRTGFLRVVLGLAGALVLAMVAAHPLVRRVEKRLGLTVVVSSGIPFLLLGVIFRSPKIGILTDDVLTDLRPALEFGLGWLGFVVGTQFDVRALDRLPPKTGAAVVAQTALPLVVVTAVSIIALLGLDHSWDVDDVHSVRDALSLVGRISLRDALALGACAAPAAPIAAVAIAATSGSGAAWLLRRITALNDIAGVIVLSLICAMYRPTDDVAAWHLPHIAWLFVTMGLGVTLGILAYVLLRSAERPSQEAALLVGATGLSAGMSGYLGISPLVTCALAGAVLTNLPFDGMNRVRAMIQQVERPLYLIFLLVAGALWDPTAWQGWLLVPVFVLARLSGKVLGAHIGKRAGPTDLPHPTTLSLALFPQSPISIATIVSYVTLYKTSVTGAGLSWLMTICVGGAVVTEIVVQILARARGEHGFEAPIESDAATIPPPEQQDV